jgi:hypothetical protein
MAALEALITAFHWNALTIEGVVNTTFMHIVIEALKQLG